MTEKALIHSLNPGDVIRAGGEVCEVMTRPLKLSKHGDDKSRVMVRRWDQQNRCAELRFDFDHDKVEVLERKEVNES